MRKRIEWYWEGLDEVTSRAKVIGGWLIKAEITRAKTGAACTLQFIPDRDHEWVIVDRIDSPFVPPFALPSAPR